MKKILLISTIILFFTQVSMAADSYPRKPKEKDEGQPTGGGQLNFMMLQQAEDAIEDLNDYEITPPKKEGQEKKDTPGEPAPETVHTTDSNQANAGKSVEKTVPDTPTKTVEPVKQCPNCSAKDLGDDAKFCKYCGAKLQ